MGELNETINDTIQLSEEELKRIAEEKRLKRLLENTAKANTMVSNLVEKFNTKIAFFNNNKLHSNKKLVGKKESLYQTKTVKKLFYIPFSFYLQRLFTSASLRRLPKLF